MSMGVHHPFKIVQVQKNQGDFFVLSGRSAEQLVKILVQETGIVKVKTRLKSDMGKVFLANSITLTPGTFTVDLKNEYLYIHWIYVKHRDMEKATQDIVSRFESFLIKIFD